VSFSPTNFYRTVLKEGMSGFEVWAIQISLNAFGVSPTIAEDGAFGPKTKAAVLQAQTMLHITADGICGPETQRSICARESNRASAGKVPAGLAEGICEGESGGIICATKIYPDGSGDYGPFQNNLPKTRTEQQLKESFSAYLEARNLVVELRAAYERYKNQPGAVSAVIGEAAWKLATLHHNWPAASDQIAAGHRFTWRYQEVANGPWYALSDPAPWVINIGVAGVSTGNQWIDFYAASKIVYVKEWSV
jgi:hypothetical protein